MKGPARLSCRSGIGRSGASRSGAILTGTDYLEPRVEAGVTHDAGWKLDDVSDRRRTDTGELSPGWTVSEPS